MQENGCRILYVTVYRSKKDIFKVEAIEKAADQILWCFEEEDGFGATRPQDLVFIGNIIDGVTVYAQGGLGVGLVDLKSIDHLQISGSKSLMAAVTQARYDQWKDYLNHTHTGTCHVSSPMQCMMKGICAQCLQIQKNPITGEEQVVYSCINQEQPLNWVNFNHLQQRLSQNSLQEKMAALWLEFIKAYTNGS